MTEEGKKKRKKESCHADTRAVPLVTAMTFKWSEFDVSHKTCGKKPDTLVWSSTQFEQDRATHTRFEGGGEMFVGQRSILL